MMRYYNTRKRNIKKSRKGYGRRRRGRRSERNSKTRKPNGFKKVNSHTVRTVGKRRRMMGGDFFSDQFNFNVTADDLQYIMDRDDSFRHINNLNTLENGFGRVVLVAYGFALVTNKSMGKIWKKYNRKEQINIFACYLNDDTTDTVQPICYAILRCARTYCYDTGKHQVSTPNFDMEGKILFLFVTKRQQRNARKMGTETVETQSYNVFQFTNSISSDDLYKILVPESEANDANLNEFFDSIASGDNYTQVKEYYTEMKDRISEAKIKPVKDRTRVDGIGGEDAAAIGPLIFGF